MIEKRHLTARNIAFVTAGISYVIALLAYYFHAIDLNPQYDTQGIRYSLELLIAEGSGNLWDWLIQVPPRKYPMLFVAPFSLVESIFWHPIQGIPLELAHYITRAFMVLYSLGTLFVLRLISRRLFGESIPTILLLFTSINFFLFSTAVRPHVAVGFWTLLTLYFSLRLTEKPTYTMMTLAFGSAACAFATLQSGIFAFIFPASVLLIRDRSWLSIGKVVGFGSLTGIISFVFGYPFILQIFSGSPLSSLLETGLQHDVGFFILPQLIPVKLWEAFSCDMILFTALFFGAWSMRKSLKKFGPILLYVAVFCLVFGTQPITAPRFFVPILPVLALVATPALLGRRSLQIAIGVLCILIYAKLAYLGFSSNTYQQASRFVNTHQGLLATHVPDYFLNVPYEKYATEDADPAQFLYLLSVDEHYPDVEALPLCAAFTATNVSTDKAGVRYMFFWHEVRYPLYYLAFTKSLGINLRLYCYSRS